MQQVSTHWTVDSSYWNLQEFFRLVYFIPLIIIISKTIIFVIFCLTSFYWLDMGGVNCTHSSAILKISLHLESRNQRVTSRRLHHYKSVIFHVCVFYFPLHLWQSEANYCKTDWLVFLIRLYSQLYRQVAPLTVFQVVYLLSTADSVALISVLFCPTYAYVCIWIGIQKAHLYSKCTTG